MMKYGGANPRVGFATLHIDGGCRPTNPGPAGIACVVNIDKNEHVLARPVGIKTNNQAEYMALIVGIKYAYSLGATGIEIYTDSMLVMNQMRYKWHVTEPTLIDLRHEARALLEAHFTNFRRIQSPERGPARIHWDLIWIPREKNTRADELCTQAILSNNPWIPNLLDPFRGSHRKWNSFRRGYHHLGSMR